MIDTEGKLMGDLKIHQEENKVKYLFGEEVRTKIFERGTLKISIEEKC
jgi:hypothetical protein